jgi:spore coat polysaccharide biosynthesis predicted glycosyltransferase SpsG
MWTDLHRAGYLITGAGSTVWEAAAVGIPVALVVFADNQALVGDWGRQCGVPVMDVRGRTDSVSIAEDLTAATRAARTLPHLKSGAELVARRLLALMA